MQYGLKRANNVKGADEGWRRLEGAYKRRGVLEQARWQSERPDEDQQGHGRLRPKGGQQGQISVKEAEEGRWGPRKVRNARARKENYWRWRWVQEKEIELETREKKEKKLIINGF